MSPIKTSLMEHFRRACTHTGPHSPHSPLNAAPALMFTNSQQEPTCPERPHSCTARCEEFIIKVTNDSPGFIAFSGRFA